MWIKIRFLCSLLKVPAPADRAYRVGLACSKNTRPSSLKSRAIIHNFQLKKKIMNGQPLKVGILCTQTLEQLKYIVNFFKSFFYLQIHETWERWTQTAEGSSIMMRSLTRDHARVIRAQGRRSWRHSLVGAVHAHEYRPSLRTLNTSHTSYTVLSFFGGQTGCNASKQQYSPYPSPSCSHHRSHDPPQVTWPNTACIQFSIIYK